MFFFRYIFLLVHIIVFVEAKNEEYQGYKVYSIKLVSQDQEDQLHTIINNDLDILRRPSLKYDVTGRVKVPPSYVDWFEEGLKTLGIDNDIIIDDLYEYLEDKDVMKTLRNESNRAFDYNDFYRYDEIVAYMEIKSTFNNTEIINYGVTAENRTLYYVRINHDSTQDRPVIIIEGGINPREWITIPAALNVVDKVLSDTVLLNTYEWIIIPVMNPDGYEYTHTNLRLWSKSRSILSHTGFICPGVNINRNFDIDWLVSGASSSPCSDIYGGIEPFSEIESQLIKYLIDTYKSKVRLYFSLQNRGGFISYPWSYEKAASGMFRQNHLIGLSMVEILNENYKIDVSSTAFDRISGTSSDFARQNNVLYAYNIDIVQKGDDGFTIPENEIEAIIDDVWQAVNVAARSII